MRSTGLTILSLSLFFAGCNPPSAQHGNKDVLGIKHVKFYHSGGKNTFQVTINSRAVHVDYNSYMAKDSIYLNHVEPQTWKLVVEAIKAQDFKIGNKYDSPVVHVQVFYVDGKHVSGFFSWSDDSKKGSILRNIYKGYLNTAADN
jgi:hypothetical protein